jgi:hypothetical protein
MIDARELHAELPGRDRSPAATRSPRPFSRDLPELAKAAAASRAAARAEAKLARVAANIIESVQSRLPGRVRDLKVRIEPDCFVLCGVSSSYYVKQVAQHLAMTALDAVMLGRLVNEIEVRTVR